VYREATPKGEVNALQRAFIRRANEKEFKAFVEKLGLSDGDLLFVGERFDRNSVISFGMKRLTIGRIYGTWQGPNTCH
jgi:hypothetical protein